MAMKDYTFRARPMVIARLKGAGFTLLNLANNHSMDYGTAAMTDTNLTRAQFDQLCAAFGAGGSVRYVSLRPFVDTIDVQSFSEKEGPAVMPRGGDFSRIRALANGLFGEIASHPSTRRAAAASMVAAR